MGKAMSLKSWDIFFIVYGCLSLVSILILGITFGTMSIVGIGVFGFGVYNIEKLYHKKPCLVFGLLRYGVIVTAGCLLLSFIVMQGLIMTEIGKGVKVDERMDYVLVLGAGLKGDKVSNRLKARLDVAFNYLSKYENVKIIVSGGQGEDELISEARAMGQYLMDQGLNESRLLYENKSTSTVENIAYTLELIEGMNLDKPPKCLLVTSDYHMYRAKRICKDKGFDVVTLASKTPALIRINYQLREYLACVKYFVFKLV